MKKTLLSLSAIALASSALAIGNLTPRLISSDKFKAGPLAPAIENAANTRASGSIDFTYADEPYSAYSLGDNVPGGARFYLLIEMTPEEIKAYAGNQVTGFTMISPTDYNGKTNTITEGQFFYTTDLKGEEYTQDFEISKAAMAPNAVALDTPYTITGEEKSLYFGYSFEVPANNSMYYIPVDAVPNSYPGSLIFGYSISGKFPTNFDKTAAAEIGALCLSIKIEGDNLPENFASISSIDTPPYLPLSGDGSKINFEVKNMAIDELKSVEVVASVTGMPDLVQTFDFSPIPFGKRTQLSFSGIKADTPAFVDLSMKITKVNGVEFNSQVAKVEVAAYDNGFEKKIVAEDATGTWCGWCPGGIEALEYLKTTYPDKAINIGVHYNDEMQINSYLAFINEYVGGFPNVWYNRMVSQTPTDPYTEVCAYINEVAAYFDYPSYAEVTLAGESIEDGKKAAVTASAEFAIATSVPHYLSFVIVEDNVGPYMQQNYFKQQRVAMNGWEKKNAKVSTVFKDVARYYDSYPGIANSLPATIEANSVNKYSIELPLSNVKGNEYRVIALLTNAVTGEIINACQYSMTKDNGAAVDSIGDENAPAEYYDLTGRRVDNPTKGIYIKKVGNKAEKILF